MKSFRENVDAIDRRNVRVLKIIIGFILSIVCVFLLLKIFSGDKSSDVTSIVDKDIPSYTGEIFLILNDNIPNFQNENESTDFEIYGELDSLGRCTYAYANVSKDTMPTEEREAIGSIKPSGWKQEKYPGVVDSEPPYLYNRCHLIGYQLTGENANERNLITGTRYFNVEGMLPFENQVRRYIEKTNNHVLYRVTPVYDGKNLVAKGVIMEAWSIEDSGKGICFNVFVYNIQPGVEIDYSDGSSKLSN